MDMPLVCSPDGRHSCFSAHRSEDLTQRNDLQTKPFEVGQNVMVVFRIQQADILSYVMERSWHTKR
jgi:hypothetical protein